MLRFDRPIYKPRNFLGVYLPGWSVPMIKQVGRLERSGTFAHQSVE